MLSEGRLTARELERVVPKEVVMASSLFAEARRRFRAEGRAKGRAEGRAEGEIAAARSLCSGFARQHHPAVLSEVAPIIGSCSDPLRLQEWALAAPRLSDAAFLRLLSRRPAPRSRTWASRGRSPRPSRRSKRR